MELNTRFRKAVSVAALSAGMLLAGAGPALATTTIGTDIASDGVLTINGNIDLNDGTAGDTIDIGDSGDTVTILGNIAVTDSQWSVTAAGVAGFASIEGTAIGNVTRANGAFAGLSNVGTLDIGTTNASEDVLHILIAAGGAARFTGQLTNNDLTAARTWYLPNASGTLITTGNLTDINRLAGTILDSNGNAILGFNPIGVAVNYLSIRNSNAGAPITLQAAGTDTDINMYVFPKGSGGVVISNDVTNADQLVLKAQTAVTDAGAAGTLTTVNLSGTRTWTLPDSSGTVSLSGHTHSAADITSGNLLANRLQSSATDLGATNVNVNLSNANGSYVTNFVTDGGLWGDGLRLTNTQPIISNIDSSVTYLLFTPEASAVNYPQFRSAATGNPVILAAKGTDANVDLTLQGQGTGMVMVNGGMNVSGNTSLTGNLMLNLDAGVTAFAGGGQASAYQISKDITGVSTVATAGDSVKLPVSMPGMRLQIFNRTANSMNIFPSSGEQINMAGANVQYALAGGDSALCVCLGPADWECHRLVH